MPLSNTLQNLSEIIKNNKQDNYNYLIIDCLTDVFQHFTPAQFSDFGKLLTKFGKLYALNFSYGKLKLWGDLQFKCLGDTLANYTSLKHLDLSSNELFEIKDTKTIQALASIFIKCELLQSIDLSNNHLYVLNEDCLNIFAKQLAKCKSLEYIEVTDRIAHLSLEKKRQRKDILTKFKNSLQEYVTTKTRLNCKTILIILDRLYPKLPSEVTNITFQFANYIAQEPSNSDYNLTTAKIKLKPNVTL
jgi:Leucine-rich repeat (LRR) protein